ncbi:MAG: DUF5343 domain-containing protein [Dehalococcoidales bacterium]|nr:DUF5343 domain-containing protein [Dehalococcoidales bacterium]
MAEAKKEVFPRLPVGNWWKLRKLFIQKIPTTVTDTYIAPLLGMSQDSARANILPSLRQIGLINEDGTVQQERAAKWREDAHYPEVCKEIINEIYPQELREAFQMVDDTNRAKVASWFRMRTKMGEGAAQMMTSFYQILTEADPTKAPEVKQRVKPENTRAKVINTAEVKIKTEPAKIPEVKSPTVHLEQLNIPSININIEVHISPEADAAQIDQIFKSMSNHLNITRKA